MAVTVHSPQQHRYPHIPTPLGNKAEINPQLVTVDDVGLIYGEGEDRTSALEHVNMAVAEGEFIAVVGPSGCGKSTLMKLLTGLLPPTSGEIRFGSEPVRRPVRGVGMAFQNPTLMPWRTVTDNVMLPLEIVEPHKRHIRQRRGEYRREVEDLLDTVGLGGFGGKFPWQLSGGMQQRANLCRALIHQPRLMMLDEPFAALDTFTREELWSVVQDLLMRKRFTAVLITHDLREAIYLADTVYVMSKRPGTIIHSARVEIPRPRTLDTTFTPEFAEIAHDLRTRIGEARK